MTKFPAREKGISREKKEGRKKRRRTEPVGRRGEALSDLADGSGEGLRVNDPGGSVPRDGVEGGPEVEEEHGRLSTGGEGGRDVVSGVGDLDVGADGEHGEGATDGTDEELQREKKSVSSRRKNRAEEGRTMPRRP